MIDLDDILLRFSRQDSLTIRALFEHIFVIGASGAGKTTSTLAMLFSAMLKEDFGGIIVVVKSDHTAYICDLARKAGREDDIILFSPKPDPYNAGKKWRINLLEYLVSLSDSKTGMVSEIVSFLEMLLMLVEGTTSLSNRADFWQRAANELVRNSLSLLILAEEHLSFDTLYALISSVPTSLEEATESYLQEDKFFWEVLARARDNAESVRDLHALGIAERFFLQSFAGMADRTRSSVQATLTTMLDVFLHGHLYELFCTKTTFTPEMSFEGKIVLLDMPILGEYSETGRIAQKILIYLWQKAALRRPIQPDTVPQFLLADEAQAIISSHDYQFLSTARSARVGVIFLTQSISSFYAAAGAHERGAVDSLLGLFNLFIFHRLVDGITAQWASHLIGSEEHIKHTWNMDSYGGVSVSGSRRSDYRIPPESFAQLIKGGSPHYISEAILFNGSIWNDTGTPVLRAIFPQQIDLLSEAVAEEDEYDEIDEGITIFVMIITFLQQFLLLKHNPALLMQQAEEEFITLLPRSQTERPLPLVQLNEVRSSEPLPAPAPELPRSTQLNQ